MLGLEGTTAWSGIEGKDAAVFGAFPGATYKTEVESLSTFVARLGFADGGWLVYGKAGVAYGEVKSTLANGGGQYFRETTDHIGWTVGIGVDYALTPNWILGLEYNYVDLGDQHYGGIDDLDYKADITVSTVLARLSYKFGAGGNPLATALLGSATRAACGTASISVCTAAMAGAQPTRRSMTARSSRRLAARISISMVACSAARSAT
ncbi:MAG: porin family protein [Bacteroidales bacterium]|nr:porin family protein [Bacteroidales bacterium]